MANGDSLPETVTRVEPLRETTARVDSVSETVTPTDPASGPTTHTDRLLSRQLEKTYVAEVYKNIASHFSGTRYRPWRRVQAFVESLPAGSLLLDVGCGNCKYFGINRQLFELYAQERAQYLGTNRTFLSLLRDDSDCLGKVGVDQNRQLCDIGRSRGHQTLTASCMSLPVRSAVADGCICIAVIHHLATRRRRVAAVAELGRVLRRGGRALVYVWALEQRLDGRTSNYLKAGRQHEFAAANDGRPLPLPVHTNRTEFRQQDVLVPWTLRSAPADSPPSRVHHRYYHVYRQGELEEDVASAGGLSVVESYYDQGNWCAVLERSD